MLFFLNRFTKIWNLFVRNCGNIAKYNVVILLLASTVPCHAQVSAQELRQDDSYKLPQYDSYKLAQDDPYKLAQDDPYKLAQDDPYKLYLQTSVATRHFHPD